MTNGILNQIIAEKKKEVAAAKQQVPLNRLIEMLMDLPPKRPFFDRLQDGDRNAINIIAEIKRASPSAGPIRPKLDAAEWAIKYESGGATALSVLTDRQFFNGNPSDINAAKNATNLPLLRKDFIVSSYQIYESAILGADAILLIVRVLSESHLRAYLQLADAIGLDALVEIHTTEDLAKAKRAGARLIGINNRDLTSFHTDTHRAVELVNQLSPNQVPVAASGIQSRMHILAGIDAGIRNFLIGEHLVRSDDPVKCLKALKGIT